MSYSPLTSPTSLSRAKSHTFLDTVPKNFKKISSTKLIEKESNKNELNQPLLNKQITNNSLNSSELPESKEEKELQEKKEREEKEKEKEKGSISKRIDKKLNKIQTEIDNTTSNLRGSVAKALDNGQACEEIQAKAEEMKQTAITFKKEAAKVKYYAMFVYFRNTIIAIAIAAVIGVVAFLIIRKLLA